MRRIHVVVRKSDVVRGKRRDCEYCPVARAFFRLPGVTRALVGASAVTLHYEATGPNQVWRIDLAVPEDVRKKILSFDKTGEMEPFDAHFPVLEEYRTNGPNANEGEEKS